MKFRDYLTEGTGVYSVTKQKGRGQHSNLTTIHVKAKSEEEAIKIAKEANKNGSENDTYTVLELTPAGVKRVKKFDSLIIIESEMNESTKVKYKMVDGRTITIDVKVQGDKAFFKVPKRDVKTMKIVDGFSDEISVSKDKFTKTFDVKTQVTNYLKSIDY